MAHLIDMSNGRANMAYAGETPWHGLGVSMEPNADLAQWRKEAGLNWTAHKAPITFNADILLPNGTKAKDQIIYDDRKVIYRDDTGAGLGVVGNNFKIVQPADVTEFFREMCDHHGFQMETMGSLNEGRVIWALAKTGDEFRLKGTDAVKGYVLLSTSFDGSRATQAKWTSVRVVCNNTLQLSARDAAAISVTHRSTFDAAIAREKLGLAQAWTEFRDNAEQMAEVMVTPEQTVQFFAEVYHGLRLKEITLTDAQDKSLEKTIKRLTEQYLNAPGAALPSAKGTAWGLVNAVTHDIDYVRRSHDQDTRLTSAWFDDGAKVKERAWEAAKQLLAA